MTAIDLKARLSDPRALAPAALLALCLLCLLFSAGAKASGGTAEGWGLNLNGQVGNGTATSGTADPCTCIRAPVPVSMLSGATQIVGGERHTLALLANGAVMAWGANESGQLGNGEFSGPGQCNGFGCSPVPIQVPGLANVVAIAAGERFSLALLANGTVMAWGRNDSGQLGNGEFSGPEPCAINGSTVPCATVPIQVPGLANVVAIAAGGSDSLALLANGTVMAWGFDLHGEIGDEAASPSDCGCADQPKPVPGVAGAMAISAGVGGGYALLGDGTVKAWGLNTQGQLGVGAISPASGCGCLGPVSVSGLASVKSLAAGDKYSLATLSSGSVQAWGLNVFGQLGNGSTTPPTTNPCSCIPTPEPASGLSGPQAIAAGSDHSLALLPDGSIEAWGRNSDGQLGDGTIGDHSTPTAVSAISGASGVSASDRDSFALIGPSQTVKVSLAGAGAGQVGGPAGILCPSACEGRYPQSQVEILRAEASPGAGFAGFSGPCSGIAPCQVRLDHDQSVTATFGPPKGSAITKATVSSRRKTASFSFSAPGAITGFQCELIRPKPHKRHKPRAHHSLKRAAHKQPKPHFSSCRAPIAFKHLGPGTYTFKVRALDILGADAHPALKHFRIKPSHRTRRPKL